MRVVWRRYDAPHQQILQSKKPTRWCRFFHTHGFYIVTPSIPVHTFGSDLHLAVPATISASVFGSHLIVPDGPPKAVQESILSHHLSDNIEDTISTTLASDVHSKERTKILETPLDTPRLHKFQFIFRQPSTNVEKWGEIRTSDNVESTYMKFALESGKKIQPASSRATYCTR